MTRVLAPACLFCLAAAGASAAPPAKIAIVVVGGDDRSAAAVQAAAEARAGSLPGVSLRRASDLAATLGQRTPPDAGAWHGSPTARAEATELLTSVRKAYFSDRAAQAAAALDRLAALLERTKDVPAGMRARVPLWRAAIATAAGNAATARNEIVVALAIDPSLTVGEELPPSVGELVRSARGDARTRRITLAAVPDGALVRLDDVAVEGTSLMVGPGPHKIEVSAPGLRTFSQVVDPAGDVTLPVHAAIALPPSWAGPLDAIAWRGSLTDADRKGVESLARRAGNLDVLAVIALRPDGARIGVWRRNREPSFATPTGDAPDAIAASLAGALTAAPATAVGRPGPPPGEETRKTPPAAPRAEGPALAVRLVAAPVFAVWTRQVSSRSPGRGFDVPGLSGAGAELRAHAGRGLLIADAALEAVQFGPIQTARPDGRDVSVSGGLMLRGRAGAGVQVPLGTLSLAATAGGFHESHAAEDVKAADGEATGTFTSHTWTGAELRAAAVLELEATALSMEAAVSPFSVWRETPAGATGRNPVTSPAFGVGLGASRPVGARGALVVVYGFQTRSVAFEGTGTAELGPRDARLTETVHHVSVGWQHRF